MAIYRSKFWGNQPYFGHWQVGKLTLIIINHNWLMDRRFGGLNELKSSTISSTNDPYN